MSSNIKKENNKLNQLLSELDKLDSIPEDFQYDDIILRKVRLSTNSLNVIDKKIKYYFTNQKE